MYTLGTPEHAPPRSRQTQRGLWARYAPLQQNTARLCLVLAQLKGAAIRTGHDQPKTTVEDQAFLTEVKLTVDSHVPRCSSTPAVL